jgi:hypothetical protein
MKKMALWNDDIENEEPWDAALAETLPGQLVLSD